MNILIDTYKHFKTKSTYILAIKDIETIVEYNGKDSEGRKIFKCNDSFEKKLDSIKIQPSKDFIFIYKSDSKMKSIKTIYFKDIEIIYPDDCIEDD